MAFFLVVLPLTFAGVVLIKVARRRSKEPQIPSARTANAEGIDAAYSKAARVVTRTPGKIGRGLLFAAGVWLISAPWLLAYWFYTSPSILGEGSSKGRVLRVRSRAQLPEAARGSDWSGDPVALRGELSAPERRTLGELWLLTARMEHASVAAFSQLGLHLAALGAPARLLEATHRAALDEIRHARACFAIVHAIG